MGALLLAAPASAQEARIGQSQQARLSTAAFDASDLERVAWHQDRDVPQFLAGDLGQIAPTAAPSFFAANAELFGFAADPEVRVTRSVTDETGLTHVRVQQTVDGIPVWGAESALHIARDGAVYAWGGDLHPGAETVSKLVTTTPQGAIATAIADLGAVQLRESVPGDAMGEGFDWTPQSEMVVYPHDGDYRLAHHVTVYVDAPVPANWEVFVDAASGVVLDRFNSIHTTAPHTAAASHLAAAPRAIQARQPSMMILAGPTTGTGASLFGGTYTLPTYLSGSNYYLYDTTRGPSYIRTMTGNNGTSLPGAYVTDPDNTFSSQVQKAAVDAHYGAITTYDYYKNTHGRSSYNGSNASITSTVHHQNGYNNAFWNGQQMVYGDGDGSTFIALVSLDIAAHELSHAVTEYTGGLIYQNESGALNEAFSDIMAVMVDRNDYLIGEQSYTPGIAGDALRYLDNPPAGDQPDNYAARYTGTGDNGGVHINSGIANKQAYLMIAGGTFRGVAVQAVGRSVTEKVWYRAMANYFTQSTNFAGARQGTIQAATDLYGAGSAQVASVTNAWAAVGVGSAASGGGGGGTGSGTPEWRYETVTYQSPHNYPNNYNNTQTYSKPGAQRVAMYFEQFATESNYDYVYIKDASGTTRASYTGSRAAFWAVVDGDAISANLVTDYSVTAYGYRVTRVAYFSDRALFGADPNPVLGFVPEAAAPDAVLASAKVGELALEVGPNPARSSATVTIELPEAGNVRVSLLDMLGREVAVPHDGTLDAGRQTVALSTASVPAGVYVLVLHTDSQRMTRQLTVVR